MAKKEKDEKKAPEPKAKGTNTTLSKAAQVALRREEISRLMLGGYDDSGIRHITKVMNSNGFKCEKSTVANDIKFILAEAAKRTNENLEDKREFANLRLESLINAHLVGAMTDVKKARLVRDLIGDQIALYGSNAPIKIQQSGSLTVKQAVDLSNISKDDLLLMEEILKKADAA